MIQVSPNIFITITQLIVEDDCNILSNDFEKKLFINENSCDLLLTRYLYIKQEIFKYLEEAILEGNVDEALFWGYELYYSGFENEIFDIIILIYNKYYNKKYSNLLRFITNNKSKWIENKDETIIGTIIINFVIRANTLINDTKIKINVILKEIDIEKYKTIDYTDIDGCKNWQFLPNISRFNARRKNCKKIQDIANKYRYNWMYYCYNTPIWNSRFVKYNGKQNHEKKIVEFTNDDYEEDFYNLYGYEFDEQPIDVQKKYFGIYTNIRI